MLPSRQQQLLFSFAFVLIAIPFAQAQSRLTARNAGIRFDGFLSGSVAANNLGYQSNAGPGLQLRAYRILDKQTTGSALAIGLLASAHSLGASESDLSTFQLGSIGPELLLMLPTPSSVRPYVSTALGLGIIRRSDDNLTNDVDYSFSESIASASASFGIRYPQKQFALLAELRYRYFSSRLLGGSGLWSLNIGIGL